MPKRYAKEDPVADFLASEGFQCGSETLMEEPSTKEPEEGSIGRKTIAGRKTISESLNTGWGWQEHWPCGYKAW